MIFYSGPRPKGPTIDFTPEVLAETFSTVILTCLSDTAGGCPTQLIWHNSTAPVERSKKYQIEQMTMRSKCKLQSILSILNVTEDDEGNYSCYWDCNNRVATTLLKVFVNPQTGKTRLKQSNDEIRAFIFCAELCLTLTRNCNPTIYHTNLTHVLEVCLVSSPS